MGRDGYTGLVVLAASLALFWATLGLERHPMVPVGPGFYPRIVLGVTAGLALLMVVIDVLARRRRGAPSPLGSRETPSPLGSRETPSPLGEGRGGGESRPNYPLVVVSFAIFAAYVLLLPYLGFRVATFAFLVALQAALEPPRDTRRWIVMLAIAVVATFATYYVFERYLHVLLPRGSWTGF